MGVDIKFPWYSLVFFLNQEWRNKICKLGKIDGRSLILQIGRYSSKNQDMNQERALLNEKLGSRLDWNNVETI